LLVHDGFSSVSRSEPLNWLPPDFVIEFTTPPVKRPNSAEIAPVSTVVSWMASSMKSGCAWLRTLSMIATPLTMIRLSKPGLPEITSWFADSVLRALLPAVVSPCTPGASAATASGFRAIGSASTSS
jgi:hypothetical protein